LRLEPGNVVAMELLQTSTNGESLSKVQ
jgi:hypothetical protein